MCRANHYGTPRRRDSRPGFTIFHPQLKRENVLDLALRCVQLHHDAPLLSRWDGRQQLTPVSSSCLEPTKHRPRGPLLEGIPSGLTHFFPSQYTGRRERIAASKNSEKELATGPLYSGFGHASW
jgi:hypothetical protein